MKNKEEKRRVKEEKKLAKANAPKKPLYKKPWFYLVLFVVVIVLSILISQPWISPKEEAVNNISDKLQSEYNVKESKADTAASAIYDIGGKNDNITDCQKKAGNLIIQYAPDAYNPYHFTMYFKAGKVEQIQSFLQDPNVTFYKNGKVKDKLKYYAVGSSDIGYVYVPVQSKIEGYYESGEACDMSEVTVTKNHDKYTLSGTFTGQNVYGASLTGNFKATVTWDGNDEHDAVLKTFKEVN